MNNDDWGSSSSSGSHPSGDWMDNQFTPSQPALSGGWHVWLTIVTLLATGCAVAAFIMLSAGVRNWGIMLVALAFTVPTATVLFSALFTEYKTDLMTPRLSRGAQALVALIATAVVFVMCCLGQLPYVKLGYQPANYIFLIDKSSSMGYDTNASNVSYTDSDPFNNRKNALADLLSQLPANTPVALIMFNHDIVKPVISLAPLNNAVIQQFLTAIAISDAGQTDFYPPLRLALDMLAENPEYTANETRIVMLTDGLQGDTYHLLNDGTVEYLQAYEFAAVNASLSCINIGNAVMGNLLDLVNETGGKRVNIDSVSQLTASLQTVAGTEESNILRNQMPEANLIAGFLFVLTGLCIGLALLLMFSRQRQFRFQLILSVLFGGAAFVLCKMVPFESVVLSQILAFSLYGLVFMKKNQA
jgi:hypothetical protein